MKSESRNSSWSLARSARARPCRGAAPSGGWAGRPKSEAPAETGAGPAARAAQRQQEPDVPTDDGSATPRLCEDSDSASDEIVRQACEQKDAWAAVEAAARSGGALIGPLRALWRARGNVQALIEKVQAMSAYQETRDALDLAVDAANASRDRVSDDASEGYLDEAILRAASHAWPLIDTGAAREALKALRERQGARLELGAAAKLPCLADSIPKLEHALSRARDAGLPEGEDCVRAAMDALERQRAAEERLQEARRKLQEASARLRACKRAREPAAEAAERRKAPRPSRAPQEEGAGEGPQLLWDAGRGKKNRWRPYAPDVRGQIAEAFRERGGTGSLVVDIEGSQYTIDLDSMEQIAHHTQFRRKIRLAEGG